MGKRNAPVVIVRKDKRLNRTFHLLAFAATGGASSVYTAGKAASNAAYNARTRKLQDRLADSEGRQPQATGPQGPDCRSEGR